MPRSSSWALQVAICERLAADAALLALLGGPRIFDHVPADAPLPLVTWGQSRVVDWSTATEDGEEHVLTLHAWTEGGSSEAALAIADAIRRALDDAPVVLVDHRLVSLGHELTDHRRDAEREGYHALVRFRAVTEPLA